MSTKPNPHIDLVRRATQAHLDEALHEVDEGSPVNLERTDSVIGRVKAFMADSPESHVMEYDTRELSTWRTLIFIKNTIWSNELLFQTAGRLLALSLFTGCLMLLQPNPEAIGPSNFMQLADSLKVFVTFLLGFFMASSITRWSKTVDGFLGLFNASRNLNMQFHALGVQEEARKCIARFGIISAIFLDGELNQRNFSDAEDRETARELLVDELEEQGTLTQAEAITMRKVTDRAGLVWIWVASLIGRLAQDGDIPAMPSPTYGRMIELVQDANEGIRMVRVSVVVQSPFVYVHTLSFLVHANNIFCALAFGSVLGTGVASIFARCGWHTDQLYARAGMRLASEHELQVEGSVWGDVQMICMSFTTSFVFPVLLQAFLQIGLVLAQPFDSVSAIPTHKLIHNLRKDLRDQDIVAACEQVWERPQFKVT